MAILDIDKFRLEYSRSIEWDKPFYLERPAVFSPAAAAQENHGSCSLMWKFISEWIPWEYTNFIDESLSFHETAYLGDWSALTKFRIKGRGALDFLSRYSVNDLSRFHSGQIKHAIQTDKQGKIVGEGVLYKISEHEYRYSGGGAYWLSHCFGRENGRPRR